MPITLAESGIYASLAITLAILVMIVGAFRLRKRSVSVDPVVATLASCGFFVGVALIASPAMTDQPLAVIASRRLGGRALDSQSRGRSTDSPWYGWQ